MTTAGFEARRNALKDQGRRNEAAILAALSTPGIGTIMVPDLAAIVGLPQTTTRGVVGRLLGAGKVQRDGTRGPVRLTPAALESPTVVDTTPAVNSAPWEVVETTARGMWPASCYAHRALQRLHASAVVARRHFRDDCPEGHPGFVARGDEGTGKTALFRATSEQVFGLPRAGSLMGIGSVNAADLRGRKRNGKGDVVTQDESRWALLPAVVLDDADGHSKAVREEFFAYCEGQIVVDGRRMLAVPAATYNPKQGLDPNAMFKHGWRRRTILMDADYAPEPVEPTIREYLRGRRPRPVNLDGIAVRYRELPPGVAVLLDQVKGMFVDRRQEWPRRGVELCILGRLALEETDDVTTAAHGTTVDYLMVCSTVPGLLRDDWINRVRSWARDFDGLAESVAAYDVAAAAQTRAREQRAVAKAKETDTLTEARAQLTATLDRAAEALGLHRAPLVHGTDAEKITARGIRAVLVKLKGEAGDAKSLRSLEDIGARAEVRLRAAETLLQSIGNRVAAEQAEAAAQRREAQAVAEYDRSARQQAKAAECQQREAGRRRAATVKKLRRLATRKTGAVVAVLLAEGVIGDAEEQLHPVDVEVRPPGWRGMLMTETQTQNRIVPVHATWGNRHVRAADLTTWTSPGVQQVIAEAVQAAESGRMPL